MAQSVSRWILFPVFIYIVKDIISGDTSSLFWYIYLFDGSYIAKISAFYTTNLFNVWMGCFNLEAIFFALGWGGGGGGIDEWQWISVSTM